MMHFGFVTVAIVTIAILVNTEALINTSDSSAKVLPEKFLGTFILERDENFDNYLQSRGYGWFMRQIIKLAKVTKIFRKAQSLKPNRYDMENRTIKKNTLFADWTLGEQFTANALDSTEHKITFDLKDNGNILTETHIKLSDPSDVETYEYSRDGDYLVMKMEWKGVVATRFYRVQPF